MWLFPTGCMTAASRLRFRDLPSNLMEIVTLDTQDLDADTALQVRELLAAAFDGDFDDDDWRHALGGVHVLALDGGALVGHAAVVPRVVAAARRSFEAGYVEAVATKPDRRGEGIATALMEEIGEIIRHAYELGVLATGEHGFYEQLDWIRWRGPSYVRTVDGERRTAGDDDAIMVLRFGSSRDLDVDAAIVCEDRTGDVW